MMHDLYTGRTHITVYFRVAMEQATEHSLAPPSHLTSQALQLGAVLQHPIYMCARILNSTPHVCAASTLLTVLTPQNFTFLKNIYFYFFCVCCKWAQLPTEVKKGIRLHPAPRAGVTAIVSTQAECWGALVLGKNNNMLFNHWVVFAAHLSVFKWLLSAIYFKRFLLAWRMHTAPKSIFCSQIYLLSTMNSLLCSQSNS